MKFPYQNLCLCLFNMRLRKSMGNPWKTYQNLESGTPPGPQKIRGFKCVFDYFMLLFPLLILYERSKFLGDVLFLVC